MVTFLSSISDMEIANSEDTPIGIKGCVPARGQLGEEEVEDDDGEEAFDEAFGAGPADAAGAGAAGETFVAGDQANGGAEEDAEDEPTGRVAHPLARASTSRLRVPLWMKYAAMNGIVPHVSPKPGYEWTILGFSLG